MKRNLILMFPLLFLANTLLAQQHVIERPQRTMEQQIKELLNHAYKEIHDAEYRQQEALYHYYFDNMPDMYHLKQQSASEAAGDTAFYNATVRKTNSNPEWHLDALEFTINYFESEDSTVILRRNHRLDPSDASWWRSNEWETIDFRGECEPACRVYTTRNFSKAGSQTGGSRQFTYPEFTEAQTWDSSINDYYAYWRSGSVMNDEGRLALNRTWSFYSNLGGFRLATHSEYEYDDLGINTVNANLNFYPDSTYSGGRKTVITMDYDAMRISEQLVQQMPEGPPDETDWVNFQRITYDYGATTLTQRQQVWDADSEEWKTMVLGYGYYSDPSYPDSAVTFQYNQAADDLLPLAAQKNVYDGNMLLVERRNYLWNAEEGAFVNVGREENTYNAQALLVRRLVFGGTTGVLFQTQDLTYEYDDRDRQIFSETLNLDMNGRISSGTQRVTHYQGDDWLGYRLYTWNADTEEWMETGFYNATRLIGERVNQVSSGSYSSWSGWNSSRTVTSFEDKPIIFNDGPIEIAEGDTVRFTIFSIDTNFDTPDLTIGDLPPGATFDPVTHEFEWVVPDDLSRTMTVRAVSRKGEFETEVVFMGADYLTSVNEQVNIPEKIALRQNYPNPFNPSTVIGFELPSTGMTRLEVFDVLGRRVAVLIDGRMDPGVHNIAFDASHLASGVYLYRLTHAQQTETRQMMLLR